MLSVNMVLFISMCLLAVITGIELVRVLLEKRLVSKRHRCPTGKDWLPVMASYGLKTGTETLPDEVCTIGPDGEKYSDREVEHGVAIATGIFCGMCYEQLVCGRCGNAVVRETVAESREHYRSMLQCCERPVLVGIGKFHATGGDDAECDDGSPAETDAVVR